MVELTELQKLKKDYPDFFKKTPPEVIDFVFSEKTAKQIADICEKNDVIDENQIEEVAQRITWVLLGKLPSGNLATTLELWVKLTPETAKKIADEANQFISSAMAQLKSGEIVQPQKELPKGKTTEELTQDQPAAEEKPKRPSSKDVYREPVE